MGAVTSQAVALALAEGRSFDAAGTVSMLRKAYANGVSTRVEAEALIALDHSMAESTQAWRDFFADTIADHVVHRYVPRGVVNAEKVEWLSRSLVRDRSIVTMAGFAAVLRVLELVAEPLPALAAFALGQIRAAVLAGERLAPDAAPHLSRAIEADDVVLIARVLEAAGGSEGSPVSRAEAEALFDLHDATAGAENHGSFDDLFFKAVAQYLIAASGHRVASRRDMLAPDPRLAERLSVFGRSAAAEAGFRLPPGSAEATELRSEELAWLASRIMRDGRPTVAEYALLRLFAGGGAISLSHSRKGIGAAA